MLILFTLIKYIIVKLYYRGTGGECLLRRGRGEGVGA